MQSEAQAGMPVRSDCREVIFVHGSLGMGGAEVLRLSVLEEMLRRPEVSVRVCVLRERGVLADHVEELGVPLDVLGNRGGLLDIVGIIRLAQYLRRHNPDIVQSSQFVTNLHSRMATWLAGGSRGIIEEHGVYNWKRWHHRLLDRLINRGADAVVACSRCVADSASKHLSRDVSTITVIHNCASNEHFEGNEASNNQADGLVVCAVGTLRWEKGYRYLLDAWRQLEANHQLPANSKLWIVGTGPLEQELKHMTKDTPSVVFLGRRDDTAQLLRSADLFVLPSVNEGFGIAIVEAMCAGLPVISTTSGGIPEVIHHGRTGILVPPEDAESLVAAIAELANDPEQRKSLSQAARTEALRRFTPKRYCDELLQLYQQMEAVS